MDWITNACYRIIYEDYSSITFTVEKAQTGAAHLIQVRDINTGRERRLWDLLLPEWIDLQRISY